MTNFEKRRLKANMLRSARGKLREILSPRAKGGTSAGDANEARQATLEAELETYRHAFETTAADRDRLAAALETYKTYKGAFETTAEDRDRLQAELDVAKLSGRDGFEAALLSHVFINELQMAPDAAVKRVESLLTEIAGGADAGERKSNVNRWLSDNLLDVAERIIRRAQISELALDLVESAWQIDPGFRGINHAVDFFFGRRRSAEQLLKYFEDGIAAGAWPDEGTKAAQQQAIERGLPSVLLVTLPKSGSIFLWSTISASLRLPMFRIAVTESLVDEQLIPGTLPIFARGGLSAQHHLAPSEQNVLFLKKNRITRFVLHLRDPRQAAVSWWYYSLKIGSARPRKRSQDEIEEVIWHNFLKPASDWVQRWLDIADNDPDFDIFISTQEEMAGREAVHIRSILEFLRIPPGECEVEIAKRDSAAHFRKGAKDEWLSFFSDEFKKRSKDLIPDHIAERFGWVSN